MAEAIPNDDPGRPRLYDVFDADGGAWLDEIVNIVNEGGYTQVLQAFLADEAQASASLDNPV